MKPLTRITHKHSVAAADAPHPAAIPGEKCGLILTVFALFILVGPASGLEIEHHRIESAVLGESREYLIHLPPSYDDPEIEPRSYPVLLLLDGEAYTPTLAGILHFMASEAVYTFQVPEMIIVGIVHPDRLRDLTPVPGTKAVDGSPLTGSERTGGGEALLEFLQALYHALLEVGDPAAARRAVETFLESVPGHQDAIQILEETSPPESDDR